MLGKGHITNSPGVDPGQKTTWEIIHLETYYIPILFICQERLTDLVIMI